MAAVAVLAFAFSAFAQDQRGKTITEVGIEGLERVSEQVVRSKLEVQAGQPYNDRAIARDIRRLYELGFFTNIKADAQPDGGGVAMTYVFDEKRVIEEIRIIGNKKLKDRRIRGVLSFREGESFVAEAYDEEREAILDLYEGKGFANTSVDIVAEKVGPSRVRLTYNIVEGRKARIKNINFAGNGALTRRQLKKVMKTRPAFWFLGGKYEEDKFEADLENIVDEYGNYGRLEADIPKTDLVYTKKGKGMNVTIFLDEGPEYTVDTLEVAGNEVYDTDEVEGIVEVMPGDVHNKGQVAADAQLVQKGYQDSGYIDAEVSPQVTLDRENKTTHVTHKVGEGELKYIREIEVTGNEVTKDEIVRRQLMTQPGDRYDGSAMKASHQRLNNTQYFDMVRLFPEDIPGEDRLTDLIVDVEEGKTGNFNFGVGFSTDEGYGGFGELRLNNFDITNWPKFSGGGQQLRLKLNLGDRRDQYSLSFTDPEFAGYPIAFGFDVFDESYEVRGGADYREDERGAQLRLGKALSPYVTVRSAFLYQETDLSELPLWVNREIRRQRGESTTISSNWQIERNTLDNRRDPSAGAKHILALQLAGYGGDHEFLKLEHDTTWYRSLNKKDSWIFSVRTREGWVNEYGKSDYVPLQDRFYAGGTTTVRGYDHRDIGPREREFWFSGDHFATGGELRVVTNIELKHKLTDMFRVYTFVDAGGVWSDASDFDLGDVKYSAGLGFGVDVPRMGPIRVDYGFPINPESDQGSGRLHLTTGFRF